MTDFDKIINKLNSSIEKIEKQSERILDLEKKNLELIDDTLKIKKKVELLINKID
tara:strand:+ start:362 stop:526 length:165 start_codon:yes stop_codon:yes gene_type:complete